MFSNGEITELLKKHPIFSPLSSEKLKEIVFDPRCKTVSALQGEKISSGGCGLSLITSGSVLVFRRGGGQPVLIQRLEKGRVFGAASLFCEESEDVTELKAETDAAVFFIPIALITKLIEADSNFAVAYIAFLSGKIRFFQIADIAFILHQEDLILVVHGIPPPVKG